MMDRVRFHNCPNTVGMRYGKKSKMFWTIVYRLCKESGHKFFSGSKNWGQVDTCKSFDKLSNSDKYQVLLELTGLCTEMNQRIWTYNLTQKMKLQNFLKRDNSIKNVDKAISACKTNMYTSAIWIIKGIEM